MLFSGTNVASGRCVGIVVGTGQNTEMGKVSRYNKISLDIIRGEYLLEIQSVSEVAKRFSGIPILYSEESLNLETLKSANHLYLGRLEAVLLYFRAIFEL